MSRTAPQAEASWWRRWQPVVSSALAALAAWAAAGSWAPLASQAHRYLWPGLVVALVIGAVGAFGRHHRVPVAVVLLVELVVAVLVIGTWFAPGHVPSPHALDQLATTMHRGSDELDRYVSPAPARFTAVAPFLTGCTALLALGIDLLACGLRRPPLAGLPLLLAVTVPISVLTQRLSPWVFMAVAALFLALIAAQHDEQLRGWGRPVDRSGDPTDAMASEPARRPRRLVAAKIGAVTIAAGLLLPLAVPVGEAGFGIGGGHGGDGGNGVQGTTLVNPLIELHSALLRESHTPMVYVHTNDTDPSYLQLTVLDQFTPTEWKPGPRQLPPGNAVDDGLPPPSGIGPDQGGSSSRWQLRLADTFVTTWLPTPSPAFSIEVPGDWRYDPTTLDVSNVGRHDASEGLRYRATAFTPSYDAAALAAAGTPVGSAVSGMTDLPRGLPRVIRQRAHQVTAGATTEYAQVVALQRWFRSTGGFRYSTKPAPGSGMTLLANFITTDKVGYCEQFAAAMAVMARVLGIPSRIVVGYLRPTGAIGGTGNYLFTSDDLHAWPQFYFAGSGWVTFDPTPAVRTGTVPTYANGQVRTHHNVPSSKASAVPSTRPTTSARHPAPTPGAASSPGAAPTSYWWAWTLLVLVALALAAAPALLRVRQRHRRLAATDAVGLASGAWLELRATALDHRIGWAEGRSPRQALALLRSRVTSDVAMVADLDRLCAFVERARYGRTLVASEAEVAEIRRIVEEWLTLIRTQVSPATARRARLLPPTILERHLRGKVDLGLVPSQEEPSRVG